MIEIQLITNLERNIVKREKYLYNIVQMYVITYYKVRRIVCTFLKLWWYADVEVAVPP